LRQLAAGVAGHGFDGVGGAVYERWSPANVGGWHVGHVLGSTIVWALSTVNAVQARWTSVATIRPEPLARSPTGGAGVMTASSCSTAVPPVAMVTVCPGPTASTAPFPAATWFPRAPF